MIVGFVGLIGSGKNTAADYLVDVHHFRQESFASTLKDAISVIFGWDRELLEGKTKESRKWRDQIDTWWALRLGIPQLTPRWVMQNIGTDVMRNHFHDDIWIASLENKLRKTADNIVITDVRFPNEIKAIKNAGGMVVRIKRGPDPDWMFHAKNYNAGPSCIGWAIGKARLAELGIHESEYRWAGCEIDHEIYNDTTVEDLHQQIHAFLPKELPIEVKLALDLI